MKGYSKHVKKQMKPVHKIDIKTNKIIDTYESCAEAGRSMGKQSSPISETARGKYKQMYGFKWQYIWVKE